VGIATLPAWRHRGVVALVTARLAVEARARHVRTVILSASDADVARPYARAGFSQVGSVGEASR
jgi:predicted GNAT family acetyltransferase